MKTIHAFFEQTFCVSSKVFLQCLCIFCLDGHVAVFRKGAVVVLGENITGFAPAKQLVKEDGTTLKAGETADFKVIEFSKATKRITLSHSRIFEEAKRAEIAAEKAEKRAAADATKSSIKKVNASIEKTTLGDIAGLAELKAAMEKNK